MIFVTGNEGKAREAREILGDDVERVDLDYTEIQADALAPIAVRGVQECHGQLDEPCFVDDSGLFVDALGGFPGPYSSYVYDTLGVEGLLRAMRDVDDGDRGARFECVVAAHDGDGIETFAGTVEGRITREQRGDGGFGYDPVFEHDGRTFAEMSAEEKNAVSHRRRAFRSLADRYRQD